MSDQLLLCDVLVSDPDACGSTYPSERGHTERVLDATVVLLPIDEHHGWAAIPELVRAAVLGVQMLPVSAFLVTTQVG